MSWYYDFRWWPHTLLQLPMQFTSSQNAPGLPSLRFIAAIISLYAIFGHGSNATLRCSAFKCRKIIAIYAIFDYFIIQMPRFSLSLLNTALLASHIKIFRLKAFTQQSKIWYQWRVRYHLLIVSQISYSRLDYFSLLFQHLRTLTSRCAFHLRVTLWAARLSCKIHYQTFSLFSISRFWLPSWSAYWLCCRSRALLLRPRELCASVGISSLHTIAR